MSRVSILLTACINPNGMSYTELQNPEIRKTHYINALKFYLANTDFKICMVENTNYDISDLFLDDIKNGRLEYLTFNGNNYDKLLGKGYGEALIINYALQNSKILIHSKYIIKVTGRLIINNINSIGNNIIYNFLSNIIRFDFMNNCSIKSTCFVCPVTWLSNNIEDLSKGINDSKGIYFEHILYNLFIKSKGYLLFPFYTPPQIIGISGTFNKPYVVLNKKENLVNNIKNLAIMYSQKNGCFNQIISKIYYLTFVSIGNNWRTIIKNKLLKKS